MAGSKRRDKVVRQEYDPGASRAINVQDPETFNDATPSWRFNTCDQERWALTEAALWRDILPKLKGFETQTWNEILVSAKKQNHSITPSDLNKDAQKRLAEKHIEAESITSLRLGGKQRLYGYRVGSVFNVLWYDADHGDNDTCVCRSRLRHT